MQTTGKIIEKLLEVSGEKENGYWVRSGFVIMTADDRGDTLCFEVSGSEKCGIVRGLSIGETVVVTWKPISRKYADKWFTRLWVYEIMRLKKEETENV